MRREVCIHGVEVDSHLHCGACDADINVYYSRERFERWWVFSRGNKGKRTLERDEDDFYIDLSAQRHWKTWQEALSDFRAEGCREY